MWETYVKSALRHNRTSGMSVMAAAFFSTLFLSLLCCLGYNLWAYEVQKAALAGSQAQMTLLPVFFLPVVVLVAFSLMLIIRSTFELSMNVRVHQFGILSSVGATPGQIRTCLLQEVCALCAVPILLGSLAGIALCFGVIEAVNFFAADVAGRQDAVFGYHAGVFALSLLASALTVLMSAWTPARRLSRLTPIQAIRNAGGLQLRRRKRAGLLSLLFGVEGELAGNALKAQRKALRIANLSLLLSFLGFSMMLCFTTLSSISTRHTYFERYRDCWDVMITVHDADLGGFGALGSLRSLPGVRDAAAYQKVDAICMLPDDAQSDALLALGGYPAVAGQPSDGGDIPVKAPLVIMDDESYLAYCGQLGISQRLDGAIVLNRIWDNAHSNFRYKAYVPFVAETQRATRLAQTDAALPILAYAQEGPLLREEYANYALVHVLPHSLWAGVAAQMEAMPGAISVRLLADDGASLADLDTLQMYAEQLLSPAHRIEIENRIREQDSNDRMMAGMQWIFGFFCALLAVIGMANVFSNTLGFLRHRKREFAQYMSVGLTPAQMRKVFAIEATLIAGRPLLMTLPLTGLFVAFAVTASYLDPVEFWLEAPVAPILTFAAAIAASVALAYSLGARSLLGSDLSEILRDDTLM